jgi:Ca2+-binding RTX toxin-like protein
MILADARGSLNTTNLNSAYNQYSYAPSDSDFVPWSDRVARAIGRVPVAPFYLGTSNNDILTGTSANEVFVSLGGGIDTITMGGGKDLLILASTAAKPLLNDFNPEDDKIFLSNKTFTSLSQSSGGLAPQNFSLASASQNSVNHIFYNEGTGGLFYDADGNGSGAAIQIATLGSAIHPSLTASSFIVG